jgi:amino acid adenylation domain-containing protein
VENRGQAGFWLSPQQEHVWQSGHDTDMQLYRSQCVVMLDGRIDPYRLRECIESSVNRHESLRTIFQRQPGIKVPFQVIRDDPEFHWKSEDRSTASAENLDAELESLALAERTRSFDFERGPLLHAALVRLSEAKHALILTAALVCADSGSLRNLVREIAALYSGEKPLADEPLRYVQFSQWQTELLKAEDDNTGEGKDYWRKQNPPPAPALIPGIAVPSAGRFNPAVHVEFINSDLTARIDDIARAENVTPGSVLLTCWHILLWRLTAQPRIAVATSFEGREYEELRNAIGLFEKNVPVVCRFDGNFRFAELLMAVHSSVQIASELQEYYAPGSTRDDHQHEAVQFNYREQWRPISAGELRFCLRDEYSCLDRFDVKLVCARGENGIEAQFHYNVSRYDENSVAQWASHFITLLASALRNPALEAGKLRLLGEEEWQTLVVDWNQTEAEFPDKCIHQLLEAQVTRTPERVAVVCGDQQLTYKDLNARANRLAHYLRRRGIGPESLVGLCLERSVNLMVGLWAILKAGGAYVPLNPDTPKPRLKQQLAGAHVVLTEQKLKAGIPDFGGSMMSLDGEQQPWAHESEANPAPSVRPDHLVYVIYTSGSTGVPKGVAVTHRNLVNYSSFIVRRLELEKFPEGLQFAVVSTIGADLGNTCIYPPLIWGGTVHLVPYETSTDTRQMARYCTRHHIDVLKIVPSHLSALISSSEAAQILPNKYLILGGEALPVKLVDRIRQLDRGCEILNHYGPTETTVGSLTLWLGREWKADEGNVTVPIGRPIANTKAYLLDAHQQPVPTGVVGELYLAGAGVARGYLNHPELTTERFLADPFTAESGGRMYRTGDLARYRPDGAIEFLGRGDDQVKVRGFRIELGEIESALVEHPGVRQAAVLVRQEENGQKRLVAYLVVRRDEVPGETTLREYLKERLPDYMMPAAFVVLDKLPLNANGKIDRQSLPAPEEVSSARAYVPPSSATEKVVAGIWEEVLQVKQVGVQDDFFKLGGHSLLATQVVSRVREHFKVEVSLRTLFEKPTVSALAEAVQTAQEDGTKQVRSSIVPVSRDAYRVGRNTS